MQALSSPPPVHPDAQEHVYLSSPLAQVEVPPHVTPAHSSTSVHSALLQELVPVPSGQVHPAAHSQLKLPSALLHTEVPPHVTPEHASTYVPQLIPV